MTFVDDIRDYVDITFFQADTDPAIQAVTWVLTGIIFFLLGLGGFIVIRYLMRLGERPAGRYEGLYKFAGLVNEKNGRKERTSIIGHLSLDNDIFTPQMIQTLKRITDIKDEYPEILKLAESEQVFFYNFKPKEYEKSGIFKENKKSIIISPIDLDDRDSYWEDMKGEFSITANGFRLFPRTVECFKTSEYREIPDPHGTMVDVHRISVVPQSLKKIQKGLSDEEFALQIAEFPKDIDAEILAKLKLYLPVLVESWQRIEPAEKEADRLRTVNQKLRTEIAERERLHEPTKHRALRKSMVGYDEPKETKSLGVSWGWRLAYFISGIFGYAVIPQISFLAWLTPYGGAFIGLVCVLLINFILETKAKSDLEKPNEANENEV